MKRKTPSDILPAPVRIVRSKIEVVHDHPHDDTSASLSASSSHSTAPIITEVSEEDTDATSISSSEDESLSESSDSSSDESSAEESDEDKSDVDAEAEEELAMRAILDATGGKPAASVYTDTRSGVTTLRMGLKPVIDASVVASSHSVLERLRRLLPELEKSNQVLETEEAEGTIGKRIIDVRDGDQESSEDDEEDDPSKPYIEMDLGLGVLEEEPAISADATSENDDMTTIESRVSERLFGMKARPSSGIHDINDETMQ